jgi:DNA-directed RNA polymerase subunit RPC12/RpoP
MRFLNHYHCPECKKDWADKWDATCDDDCPYCGCRHISPHRSEDNIIELDARSGRGQITQ